MTSGSTLGQADIALWREDGFIGPFVAHTPAEMAGIRARLDRTVLPQVRRFAARAGRGRRSPVAGALRRARTLLTGRPPLPARNRHLDVPEIAALCAHEAVVGRVAGVLGPDLVLWRSQLFVQTGEAGGGLPWHQDQYLTLLAEPRTSVSVHLAITPATERNCVLLIPGSHRLTRDELSARYGLRFQPGSDGGAYGTPRYAGDVRDPRAVRRMVLQPGEFFLFDERVVHASSEAERSPGEARIALASRITIPRVEVLPAAFRESWPLAQRCVLLSGGGSPPPEQDGARARPGAPVSPTPR